MKIKKIKRNEPELITDEKEIWYCNEVLPLKAEISELTIKNKHLEKDLKFVLEQVLGAFKENWCIDWGFADIRKKYNIPDNYVWNKEAGEDIELLDISRLRKDENCFPITVEIMAKINEIIEIVKEIRGKYE